MATYINGKCRLCRREGEKLYLKGEKCFTVKCSMVSRNYFPGQHGPNARKPRLSEFGLQLREKQKVKRIYGIMERQFREYVNKAVKNPTETGDALIRFLEQRLDNVVYRLGFAPSRRAARQIVGHGQMKINGRTATIPSYQVKTGSVISLSEKWNQKADTLKIFEEINKKRGVPEWLSRTGNEGKVETIPDVSSLKNTYNTSLIVEFYSR